MRHLVITRTPARAGLIGTFPEKWEVTEMDGPLGTEELAEGITVPLGGEALVVPVDAVVRVRAKLINEVIPT